MPIFAPVRMIDRPPSIGKEAVVSPWRGILRAQKWPRPRGLPKDRKAKARLELFALVQRIIKNLNEFETRAMREGIRQHNKEHAGQRGSAAIRQRDWHHQRLMGRGFAFDLPDGTTLYPAGVHRTASKLLDHIADLPGELAHRQADSWDGVPPPTSRSVLTQAQDGSGAFWNQIPTETT